MPDKLNNRAYSLLEIKALDESKREITGVATTPEPDRVGDVVEPLGAKFAAELPLLWQHQHDKPVGTAKFGKPTKTGIPFTATLPIIDEPGALKDLVDMAWQSVKAKLVRGVSIGFRAIEYSFIENGGVRFSETEIFELSLVTIPANASASIHSIKSIDTALRAASGIEAQSDEEAGRKPESPGVSGTKKQPATGGFFYARTKGKNTMNVQEQIKALEDKRVALTNERTTIQTKAVDEGRTKDAQEQERFAEITSEVDAIDKELVDLRVMEKDLAAMAKPVKGQTEKEASESRGTLPVSVKDTTKLEKGIEFARFAMCQLAAKGNAEMALKLAKNHYPQNERVVKALELQANGMNLGMLMKATVEAGTTLDTTWAGPLVDYQNFAGDFVEFLRPRTIIGQFGQGSVPSLNRIPFNVRIAGQTTGGSAYWVGEGAPKPLTSFDFTATELRWNKVAAISVLTNELIRFSNPSAERLVRDGLAAAVIERIDIDFIDPAKTAVANVSPASITNGATAIASSGSDAAAIRADIQALWAPFIAARNAPRNAVYIMDSTTALALSLMQNPLGQSEFPGITMNGGTFMGVPVIVSDYLPASSAGGIVVLANASDIWLADDGQVTVDASQEASLQMLDNPTNNSATGTATSMVSMFQTNSTAFRAERYINWARRRASGVAYLTGVSWGA
ncbi:phage major capsid protein [Bacillus thuringiensis]